MIGFTELQFIFRFFPVFFAAYYLFPERFRPWVMTIGSLVFYATGDPHYVLLLGALIVANWVLSGDTGEKAGFSPDKIWLIAAIVMDATVLVVFKLLALKYGQGMLPVGVSFYTFRMISYQADVYKGRISKKPSFIRTAAYFSMFPQLVSGPIARYNEISVVYSDTEGNEKALKKRIPEALENLEQGLCYFIPGLAMKVLLADHLSICWNDIGTIGYESISTPLAWMGSLVYSLELYFDFWGYSLMAAGIGVMLGYPFIRNFEHPYASRGVSEFYRRWHITLGTWFRDYVYIPLGGSRQGELNTAVNLFIVWAMTGLWHGVTLNFILWSMLLFAMILWEKNIWNRFPRVFAVVGRLEVFILIPVTWTIFAIPKTEELLNYLGRMFNLRAAIAANPLDLGRLFGMYWPYIIVGLILLIPGLSSWYVHNRKKLPVKLALLVLFWASVYSVSAQAGNPFMYLQF